MKLDLDLEGQAEKLAPEMPNVPYEFQAPWNGTLGHTMMKFVIHQVISDRRLIMQLLGVKAPIKPVDEKKVMVITCPKCSHEIEVNKVPNVQRWLEAQKGK
jgi:hypothetical protein